MSNLTSMLSLLSTRITDTIARDHLAQTSKDIISWNLTPWTKVYVITSPRHIQVLFRPTPAISSDKFFHLIYENMWGASVADRDKFLADKSGRGKIPLPGYEDMPPDQRYFARLHAILMIIPPWPPKRARWERCFVGCLKRSWRQSFR